jgi:CBS domain-containing protein
MTVARILSVKGRKVITAPPTASVAEVARTLAENRIGAVVITVGPGKIKGIVSERDIVRAVGIDGPSALQKPVSAIMTAVVRTCQEADTEAALMAVMTTHRIRHLPVVNRDDQIDGMVSIGDVVKHHIEAIEREAEEMRAYIATSG